MLCAIVFEDRLKLIDSTMKDDFIKKGLCFDLIGFLKIFFVLIDLGSV